MSLETLLEAARYVEQQENKRSRTTSITTVDRSHLNMPPHANHFQTQYHLQSHQLSDIVVERRVGKIKKINELHWGWKIMSIIKIFHCVIYYLISVVFLHYYYYLF